MSNPSDPTRTAAARYGRNGRPMTNVDLVEELCDVSGALRELKRAHLATYGNLIPHVFMADVLEHIGRCLAGKAQGSWTVAPETQQVIDVLESGMTFGDRETRNVIAISFTRDSEVETFFQQLLPLLGPKTRAQLLGK